MQNVSDDAAAKLCPSFGLSTEKRRPLRRAEASEYLFKEHGLAYKAVTLAKLAVVGGSPPYRLAGRFPLYDPNDLDIWAAAKLSGLKHSTSDNGGKC